jgi:acetyl esterase
MTQPPDEKYADLEPGIAAFMIAGERFYPPGAVNFTLDEQREFYDRYCVHFRKPRPAAVAATDFSVGHVPCRRYHRAGTSDPPVLVYLHGGGHVVGGLDSHDDVCAEICDQAGVDVVGIHYRLAPENPFPAALEDALAVYRHLRGMIVIGGDSAGGNLAAATCLKLRDAGEAMPAGQVLIYPGLGGDIRKGSYITRSNAPGLSTTDVLYYRDVYRGGGSKYAEPLRETDYRGLPPAFLVAAGLDPLHDDCEAYAGKLRAAGVAAMVRDEPQLVHAFLRARHMSEPARASFAAIVEAVRALAYDGRLPKP